MRFNTIIFVLIAFLYAGLSFGQIREYRIHSRSMLHETVFNTGEIGRAWMYGAAGDVTGVPLMEWPPNSATSFGTTKYSGQENSIGGGLYIAANPIGKLGTYIKNGHTKSRLFFPLRRIQQDFLQQRAGIPRRQPRPEIWTP